MKGDSRKRRQLAAEVASKVFMAKGKKGQLGMTATVGAAIAVAITIIVGLVVIANVTGAIDRDSFTAAQNTTFDQVVSNVNNALVLLAVGIIVLAAAAILIIVKLISG